MTLTEQERKVYGNRCPEGYEKMKLLGKGGCALVWLGKSKGSEELVAMKQFPKSADSKSVSDIETSKTERIINKTLFNDDGTPRSEIEEHPGVKYISALVDSKENNFDMWLVYQLGGQSLTRNLYDVKGEFYKGERLYNCLLYTSDAADE